MLHVLSCFEFDLQNDKINKNPSQCNKTEIHPIPVWTMSMRTRRPSSWALSIRDLRSSGVPKRLLGAKKFVTWYLQQKELEWQWTKFKHDWQPATYVPHGRFHSEITIKIRIYMAIPGEKQFTQNLHNMNVLESPWSELHCNQVF